MDIPIDLPPRDAPPPPAREALAIDSLLPAARTLQPDSSHAELGPVGAEGDDFDNLEIARTEDAALEQARTLLLAAVRREAPLSGSLTMLRLRRARTRDELAALIEEVEARIVKPHRSLAAQQVLRRSRHLLALETLEHMV